MSIQEPRQRRELHFNKIDDIPDDAARLAQAEQRTQLRQLGNWTLGQAAGHIAAWINFGFDGAPIKVSWLTRMVARRMRRKFIYKPMNPGGKLPGAPGGTYAAEPLPTGEGLARLKKACARLKGDTPKKPHPVFGVLSSDEWKNLHLRHAELHLSFLRDD